MLSLHAKSSSLSLSLSHSHLTPTHHYCLTRYEDSLCRKKTESRSRRELRGKQHIPECLGELRDRKAAFGLLTQPKVKTQGKLTLAPIRIHQCRKVTSKPRARNDGRLQPTRLSGTSSHFRQKLILSTTEQPKEINSPSSPRSCSLFPARYKDSFTRRSRSDQVCFQSGCICLPSPYKQTDLAARLTYGGVAQSRLPALRPVYVGRCPGGRPVIAIYFDGVVGDYYKRCLNDTSPKSIRLRKNAELGLQWLQQSVNLVFITEMTRKKALRVLNHFHSAHITFQAAYLVPIRSQVVDYSSLLCDLQVNIQQLLVVSSLDVAYEDLKDVSERSIYVKAGVKVKLLGNALPVIGESSPLTLLIPSLKAQPATELLAFDQVASCIQYLRTAPTWASAFLRLTSHPAANMCALTTGLVAEAVLERTLKVPRADVVRKGVGRVCGLHKTLVRSETVPCFSSPLIVLTQFPAHNSGCDLLESKALHVKSGFLNLLDYTTFRPSPRNLA